ncbi:MAG: hypothetical protein ACPGPF_00120, partial [Pontibacterium sp.]
ANQLHATAQDPLADWLDEISQLVEGASSLEQIRDGLIALKLPNNQMADAMSQALNAAVLAGRYELLNEAQ